MFSEQKENGETERHEDWDTTSEQPVRNWAEIFEGNDLTTVEGISRSYAAFKNTPVPWRHEQFFAEAFRRVPPGGEGAIIEAAGNTPAFDLHDLRSLLEQVPDAWRGRASVKQGMVATLKAFCRRFCMSISKNRRYQVLPFDLACTLAGLQEADIIGVVLDAIGESSDLADSGRLFSLVGLLTSMLSPDEALEALTFGLSLFDPVLEDKDGDGPWARGLTPPISICASIAGYIWAGLAAPSAKLRWGAAHAVLGLCALGRNEVLGHLVTLAESKAGGPFVDPGLPFYQLHARQWLLIALARAADDYPAVLVPFASRFVDWAINDQPHVLIRLFAARAALALIANRVFVADSGLVERLSLLNVTALPFVESKFHQRHARAPREPEDDPADRFYFGYDLERYWFEPLGRVFGLSQSIIKIEALKVLRDEFDGAGNARFDDDERLRRKIYSHEQTYASHGAYPDTDDFQFYCSYHAMMIVAGRLLATTPMHRDTEWGEQDEFAEWLSGHDLSRNDGRWLADRRDPVPLEWPVWRDQQKGDAAFGTVASADFDQVLWTENGVNVWGNWTTADSAQEQTVHVRSAVVSHDRSMALLRALRTVKDARDYLLPSADAEHQIDRPGFILKGWIEDRSRDRGLDGRDYWSGGIQYPPPVPAEGIIKMMALETDPDKRIWRDRAKTPVMSSQVWGHPKIDREDNNPERGERLQAAMTFILDMLDGLDRDLIVEVQIERRRRHRRFESGEDDDGRIPTQTKLYLIRADRSVTTL